MRAAFFDLDRGLLRPRRGWLSGGRRPRDPAAEVAERLRPQAAALIAAHGRQGHFTVLLTAGSAAWGRAAVRQLAADGVVLAPENDASPPLPWRLRAVLGFCARYDFAAAVSHGYGAQAGDASWLETLGYPAVIHPAWRLRRRARRSGWVELDLEQAGDPAFGEPAPPL